METTTTTTTTTTPAVKTYKHSAKMLWNAVNALMPFVPKRSALPICECLYFNGKGIHTTDLETFAYIPYPNFPECIVNASELKQVLPKLAGMIKIAYNPEINTLVITDSSGSQFKFCTWNIKEYPDIKLEANVTAKHYVPALSDFIPFVSKDELKPAMNGVCIGPVIAATDGWRLLVKHNKEFNPDSLPVLMPAKIAKYVKEPVCLTVMQQPGNNEYMYGTFSLSNRVHIRFQLMNERYPNVHAVIPTDNPIHLSVNKTELQNAISKVLPSANNNLNQVILTVDVSGQIELHAFDIDFSKESKVSIPCNCNDNIRIAFNGKSLLEILNGMDADSSGMVNFEMSTATRAALIKNDTTDIRLLMPVMITEPVNAPEPDTEDTEDTEDNTEEE